MDSNRNSQRDPNTRPAVTNRTGRTSSVSGDLPDSEKDQERLQPEETIIDLPDVKDIPGQEFVHAPPLGALGDTTIASDDEEGVGVFDEDETENLNMGNEADVRDDERAALSNADYLPTRDQINLDRAAMDSTDFDGTRLNEGSFGRERSGADLDVPGSEADNANEAIGEEDEENNDYSLGGEDEDKLSGTTR